MQTPGASLTAYRTATGCGSYRPSRKPRRTRHANDALPKRSVCSTMDAHNKPGAYEHDCERFGACMDRKWEYCTMVATHTLENRMLVVSILKRDGGPECHTLRVNQVGAAIAQLGIEGWE